MAVGALSLHPNARRVFSDAGCARQRRATTEFGSSAASALLVTLERTGFGAIIVDERCHILEMNAVGRAVLLRIEGNATMPDFAFQACVNRLLMPTRADFRLQTGWRTILTCSGRPVAFHCLSTARECTIVILAELDGRPKPNPETLRRMFGLTPKEASLAMQLADGHTLTELATQREVSVKTLRVQLNAIFQKTQTRRQTELAILLGRVSILP